MKIDRPTIWTPPEPLEEKTGTPSPGKAVEEKTAEPVQLQKNVLPKTDSVEMKQNPNVILDNIAPAPNVDPSQTTIKANEFPAGLIPGVPFREKAELPKTLPNGTSIDSGVGSGDLGFGKTRPGPNHMGIDMKGTDIRNQLDDALKLKEGAGVQSSAPPSGTVDYTTLGGSPKTEEKYEGGFDRPGMGLVSADVDKNPFLTLTQLPKIVEEVTGRAADFLDGIKAILNPNAQEKKYLKEKEGDGIQGYVNPDADGSQPVTDETLEKVGVRLGSKTQPGVEEHLQEIDGSKISGTDPRRELISNPNTEDQSSSVASGGNVNVMMNAKGPDTVNPNDPELGGGGEPIVIDPNRPKP